MVKSSPIEACASQEMTFSGTIAINSGTIHVKREEWQSEMLTCGLRTIVIDRGELLCQLPNRKRLHIKGPCVCTVWSHSPNEALQCFLPGEQLYYTAITTYDRQVGDVPAFCEHIDRQMAQVENGAAVIHITPANAMVRRVHAQMASCPLQGTTRQLWLTGKALEIVAHTLEAISPELPSSTPTIRLSSIDVECLHRARTLLETNMASPPSLEALSLAVGINTRKLSSGFKALFGESVYGYLQRYRLEMAWLMLTEQQMNISSIAWKVGYTPAHLSVAFRKKYGVSPKALRT